MKKNLLYLLVVFYILAGVNHFWHARFYYPLMPPYFQPWAYQLNIIVAFAEIGLGCLMLYSTTRRLAAFGIILLLIAFIPTHIYFINIGSCIPNGLCVPQWVGWLRLVVIHPILIIWVWWVRR